MPETTWNTTTINGVEYLVIDTAQFRVPLDFDPTSNVFIAVAAPTGGVGNFPALVKGDPGKHAEIDADIDLIALEYNDPTPDGASWTTTTAPTDSVAGVYKLTITLHKGPPGTSGTMVLDPNDYGTPVYKKILAVNSSIDGFEYVSQKAGDLYLPASINSVPSGNASYTLAQVSIPGQGFDWRPTVYGQTIITGTGADVQVDLVARLNGEASGNIVGRAFGRAGATPPPHVLVSGSPAGSADSYNKVAAGAAATVHLRTERQTGADTYTTSSATSSFAVKVNPIP